MYQVLYRKWRPQTFLQVVGQPHITSTLSNELESGKLSHAYLFTGSRGTGKTSCAKILAKAVNCLAPVKGNPCNECEICKGIDDGSIMDVIEIDAASNNGVDNIRDLREEANYTPVKAKYRVYIIDEVHMLSIGAFNALLKTLEEPPSHVLFILATTEVHKLPSTILSRCQRFDFRRIPQDDMAKRLEFVAEKEGMEIDEDAAVLISRIADGALRDALSILDRCFSNGTKITSESVSECVGIANRDYVFKFIDYICENQTSKALELLNDFHNNSFDVERLCSELINHFRNLMIAKTVKNPASLIICTTQEIELYLEQSKKFKLERILYSLSVLQTALSNIKKSLEKRIEAEMAVIRLCSDDADTSALFNRIEALESAIKHGGVIESTNNKEKTFQTQNNMPQQTEKKMPVETKNEKPDSPQYEPKHEEKSVQNDENKNNETQGDDIPFSLWPETIVALNEYNKPLVGVLSGSSAFIRGNFILIKSNNPVFEQFVKISSHANALKEAIFKITGKKYRLGIYKTEENTEKPSNDPLSNLINKINNFNNNQEE